MPLLRRALAEPPPASVRGDVLLELGTAERLAGDAASVEHLRMALSHATDASRRLWTAHHLASAQYDLSRYADAVETLRTALREAPDDVDPAARDIVRLDLVTAGILVSSVDPNALMAELSRGAPPADPVFLSAARLAGLALSLAHQTEPSDVLDELEAALAGFPPDPRHLVVHTFLWWVLAYGERPDAARRLLAQAEADGPGWQRRAFSIVLGRGAAELVDGDLEAAAATYETGLGLGRDDETGDLFLRVGLALACVELGEIERAEAALSGRAIPSRLNEGHLAIVHRARGAVLAARGDDEAAAEAFATAITIQRAFDNDAHPVWEEGGRLHGECWLRLGRTDEVLADAEQRIAVARRLGLPGLEGIGLRMRGLARDDLDDLVAGAELLERAPRRLERARAWCDVGAHLRRAGRRSEAREPLLRALDLAHTCGARPLEQRAREELIASGARPRRSAQRGRDALTVSALRVARLAAAGRANRDIARELFVTTRTVEGHLGKVFRKLDVSRREDLGVALDADAPTG